jgi:Fe-S oxidoreductase
MLGEENYQLCRSMKKTWDPHGIFNPGKIVDTAPMDTHLRYEGGQETPEIETIFDFTSTQGIVRAAEQCNGSGDCRKSEISGGTMCPSYMATRNEKDTTRARANILREMITKAEPGKNHFDHKEIKEVMDLCLSCKGCKSECPSNVDLGKLKAEFQHHYYEANGVPFRTRLIAGFSSSMKLASGFPTLFNWIFRTQLGRIMKLIIGFAPNRSMPEVSSITLRKWLDSYPQSLQTEKKGEVYLFVDEFTNYNDSEIGQTTVRLMNYLGYEVRYLSHLESGRTYLSKGLLQKARNLAESNVSIFSDIVNEKTPLVGIEPSAILTFRDEYPELLRGDLKTRAEQLSQNTFTIEEFLVREWKKGKIDKSSFAKDARSIRIHGHCHQKALGAVSATKQLLSIPEGFEVKMIPSGCCGMAGSFGYEREHFDVSMKIAELVLLPKVREFENEVIVAPGTSCRHQIKDGANKRAYHPVEVLYEARSNRLNNHSV